MYTQGNNPFKKRMGDFKHSDAPDAKGKFKSYAAKMRKTMNIVRKRLGKKDV